MESKAEINLNYTEEFRIACTINNLKFEEVLQSFIDHVSFYVFNGGEMDPIYQWATKVIVDFKLKFKTKIIPRTNQLITAMSLKYVGILTDLTTNPDLSYEMKAHKSFYIMESWSCDMLPLSNYPAQIELNDKHILTMPFNFNLLCDMNGVNTEKLLQYFIDNTSLAEDRALNLYEIVEINPCTAVLLLMLVRDDVSKRKHLPQERIYVTYGLKLLELDEELEYETNLTYKIALYKGLYADWYHALRVRAN